MTSRDTAQVKFDALLNIIRKPGGYARLSIAQRKFLYGVLLASVVPADRAVKPEEIAMLRQQLQKFLQISGDSSHDTVAMASLPQMEMREIEVMAEALGELLGVQDRTTFVRHLWELALADGELHVEEEKLIFRISDVSGVPRKQVAEQLARVAAQH
jgi:uncharacterized tellurite resistance protein B-like protein